MLSFLREQNSEDSSAQKPLADTVETSGRDDGKAVASEGTADSNEQPQNSEGTEDSNEQPQNEEYLTVTARKQQVFKGTILLAILFGTGLVCLFLMIKSSSPQSASASLGTMTPEEAEIEAAIVQFTDAKSEMFGKTDQMIQQLNKFSDIPQVKTGELVKNPFRMERYWGNQEEILKSFESDTNRGVAELQLLSIMKSNNSNCCMIDDKILYEGDSINGFEVRTISNNSVKLCKGDKEVILKLAEY